MEREERRKLIDGRATTKIPELIDADITSAIRDHGNPQPEIQKVQDIRISHTFDACQLILINVTVVIIDGVHPINNFLVLSRNQVLLRKKSLVNLLIYKFNK